MEKCRERLAERKIGSPASKVAFLIPAYHRQQKDLGGKQSERWSGPDRLSQPRVKKRSLPIAGNLAMCHIVHMDRDQIIAKLREHAPELKAAGVVHLFLHGSYARGTAIRGSSDVDVIAEFDPRRRLSLVDMVAIENRLADLLGVRVDLSPDRTLKEPVRNKAKREAVLAF